SYMATKDEAHTTRGRANVLRLALSGQLGDTADEAVLEALDLCLECRACKSECPVGVDVAAFKSEYLADYYARFGTPLKARALGGLPDLSVWASALAPVANALLSSGPGRWINQKLVGIDARRPMPAWTGKTFEQRLGEIERNPGDEPVTLFNDTFL